MDIMKFDDIIWIASLAFDKKMDKETLKYSDYMYGHEDEIDDVWIFVRECEDIGKIAFKEKYSKHNLYF
jgi:hypothetical protein